MTTTPPRSRPRALYERVAPWVVMFCLVGVLVCSVLAVVGIAADNRQDRAADAAAEERVTENRDFLSCLDDYVTALGTSLPPVRHASIARDEAATAYRGAQQKFTEAFSDLLTAVAAGNVTDVDALTPLRDALIATRAAGRALDDAEHQLVVARAENPYPELPSEFCTIPDPTDDQE